MSRRNEKPLSLLSRYASVTAPAGQQSPCFRTTSDGRIPLIPDWDQLLSGAAALPKVSLQTRHNYARLVSTASLGELLSPMSDEPRNASLSFRPETWRQAWGRVAFCPCCQSPGRIEICNPYGLDVIQICALPDYPIDTWADYIGQNYADGTTTTNAPKSACNRSHLEFPEIPTDAIPVAYHAQSLLNLFEILRHENIPVEATLDSGSSRHEQLMILSKASLSDRILTLHGKGAHAQIALPAVRALAASTQAGYQQLHLVGADRTCLFTFSAHPTRLDDWEALLPTLFPKLS